jgi:hypothetical protein
MSRVAAALRFARDHRGYEHFYLVEPSSKSEGNRAPRILYWFRTPPGIRIGRPAFDEEMRRAIAARNPDVVFDWKRLLATPIPPPAAELERWRERRRAEKAEKAARAARRADLSEPSDLPDVDEERDAAEEQAAGEQESALEERAANAPAAQPDISAPRRRRRRRRRRGRGPSSPAESVTNSPNPPSGSGGEPSKG